MIITFLQYLPFPLDNNKDKERHKKAFGCLIQNFCSQIVKCEDKNVLMNLFATRD